jgi:hypothetical protein
MIVPYIPLFFVMIMIFAPYHDRCRGQVRSSAAAAWSHQTSTAPALRPRKASRRCATWIGGENWKPASAARIAKQVAPNAGEAPSAKAAVAQPSSNASTDVNSRTIKLVTAAAAVAEQLTAVTAFQRRQQNANGVGRADRPKAGRPRDPQNITALPTRQGEPLVAVVVARPDINSVSDLAGKSIAIDGRQSAFKDKVQQAIAGAGAAEIKLSGDRTKAIKRLVEEAVPAAVVALVSPDAAEGFPEVAGFKIFRIPLPPR